MGGKRVLGLGVGVLGMVVVLASCAQPGSGAGNMGPMGLKGPPAVHGNALGIHPAGPSSARVCPGPAAPGFAECRSRVIVDKHGRPKTTSTPAAYIPAQIQAAYGFDALYSGSGGALSGSGQTIAIVDAYDDPNITADLGTFKTAYHITGCSLTKVDQTGNSNYPSVDAGWALEISLDVEWACAIAPGAKILLVEANSNSFNDLMTAVGYAESAGAQVVSMSWGGTELSSETSTDHVFQSTSVTFTAASGDGGAGVNYPAASPYVVAVGGTTLPLDGSGNRTGPEIAWSGSGGGVSAYESQPAFQTDLLGTGYAGDLSDAGSQRGVPDVAYDADPSTGFSVYDSTPYQQQSGWFIVGGTSAGAPQWAALYALADQQHSSVSALGSLTYRAAKSGLSASGAEADFTDITSGQNCNGHGRRSAICQAGPGYDFVTGLGSPLAGSLVPAL